MAVSGRARRADPATICRELCEAAAAGGLPRLLLLLPPARGEEEVWFGERILEAAREAGRDAAELELLELDGGSPDFAPDPLDGFLRASSLFGGERALLFGRAAKPLARWPRLGEALLQAARNPGGPVWMVVQAAGSPGARALKGLPRSWKAGDPVRVERLRRLYTDPPPWNLHPDASELARFAVAEARGRGMTLEPGVAGLLGRVVGSRPGEVCQALEHFSLLGMTVIDEEAIREVAAQGAEGGAFGFAEALLTGDGASALRRLRSIGRCGLRTWNGRVLAVREAFSLLLGVAAGERRRTAQVREGLAQGLSLSEACRQAGVAAGGPPLERMKRRLERCGSGQLERLLAALCRAERRVKMEGWQQAGHALEELILTAHRSREAGG